MKHNLLSLSALVPCLLLTACPRNHYDIALKPDGDGLERTLTCRRHDPDQGKSLDFPEKELKALMELYPDHEMNAETRSHTFRGRIVGATPDDVGGAGMFLRQTTSMGSLSRYVERFRGETDQRLYLEQREEAADRFTDWLSGWLESELGREQGFAKLHQFLGESFRYDIKNLSLMINQMDEADLDSSDSPGGEGLLSFVELYLYERDYFSLEETASLRALWEPDTETQVLAFAKRWLAGRMGFEEDAPLSAAFDFLKDMEALETSLVQYMQGTEGFQERLEEWRTETEEEEEEETTPPDPAEVFVNEGMEAFFNSDASSGSTEDDLTATLKLPVTPCFTNGKWDAETGIVRWEAKIESRKPSRLPVYFLANWTVPDETFQKARFGRVLLTGEKLGQYVSWVDSLTTERATEWDAFLADLAPGEPLEPQLDQFRFSDEKDDADSSVAYGAALIQAALKEKPDD